MSDRKLLEQALESLQTILGYRQTFLDIHQVMEDLKTRLAQPEQEPVSFYVYKPTLPIGNLGNVSDGDLPWIYDQDKSSGYSARMLVYTAPPQREWQGLTDEEIIVVTAPIDNRKGGWVLDLSRAIEAKLKEKNT